MPQIEISQSRTPGIGKVLKKILDIFDRFFNFTYGSKYNPLYRSGTFAAAMMFLLIISGLYLIFFYRISSPFESILNIQNNIFLGKAVRSFHRYVSDLTVVALFFHVLRMIVEGKTWGPRFLAWTSGVVLLFMFFLSGWTGYVMVWDRHGQKLAIAGARLVDSLGILTEPLMRGFSGANPAQSSFFFMNLFLHVAIPLGLIGGIWLHTSRLARSRWWFDSKIVSKITISFLVLWALVVKAPIASSPDFLKIDGIEPTDLFFNFWLPYLNANNAKLFLFIFVLLFFFLLSMTFWWKPSQFSKIEKSKHDQLKCEGCKQCEEDCPFDAISMIPRTQGTGSEVVAFVNENLCVACGLCSGSCSQLAIGPPSKSGRMQLEIVKELRHKHTGDQNGIVMIFCSENFNSKPVIEWMERKNMKFDFMNISCIGSIHPATIQTLLHTYGGVFIVGCPAGLCVNREGMELACSRILEGRNPAHEDKLPKDKIFIGSYTNNETDELLKQITHFYNSKNNESIHSSKEPMKLNKDLIPYFIKVIFITFLIFAGISYLSAFPTGHEINNGAIALSWKMPRQSIKNCRTLTNEELAKLPMHMRTSQKCDETQVPYHLVLKQNGKVLIDKMITSHGVKSDRPIYVNENINIDIGKYEFELQFVPNVGTEETKDLIKVENKFQGEIIAGKSTLVTWSEQGGFKLVQN